MSKTLSNNIMERSKFLIEKARALASNTEKVSSIKKDIKLDEVIVKDVNIERSNNPISEDIEIYNKEFAKFDKYGDVTDLKITSNFDNTQNDSMDDQSRELSNVKTSEKDMNIEVNCIKSEQRYINNDKKRRRDFKKDHIRKNSDDFNINQNTNDVYQQGNFKKAKKNKGSAENSPLRNKNTRPIDGFGSPQDLMPYNDGQRQSIQSERMNYKTCALDRLTSQLTAKKSQLDDNYSNVGVNVVINYFLHALEIERLIYMNKVQVEEAIDMDNEITRVDKLLINQVEENKELKDKNSEVQKELNQLKEFNEYKHNCTGKLNDIMFLYIKQLHSNISSLDDNGDKKSNFKNIEILIKNIQKTLNMENQSHKNDKLDDVFKTLKEKIGSVDQIMSQETKQDLYEKKEFTKSENLGSKTPSINFETLSPLEKRPGDLSINLVVNIPTESDRNTQNIVLAPKNNNDIIAQNIIAESQVLKVESPSKFTSQSTSAIQTKNIEDPDKSKQQKTKLPKSQIDSNIKVLKYNDKSSPESLKISQQISPKFPEKNKKKLINTLASSNIFTMNNIDSKANPSQHTINTKSESYTTQNSTTNNATRKIYSGPRNEVKVVSSTNSNTNISKVLKASSKTDFDNKGTKHNLENISNVYKYFENSQGTGKVNTNQNLYDIGRRNLNRNNTYDDSTDVNRHTSINKIGSNRLDLRDSSINHKVQDSIYMSKDTNYKDQDNQISKNSQFNSQITKSAMMIETGMAHQITQNQNNPQKFQPKKTPTRKNSNYNTYSSSYNNNPLRNPQFNPNQASTNSLNSDRGPTDKNLSSSQTYQYDRLSNFGSTNLGSIRDSSKHSTNSNINSSNLYQNKYSMINNPINTLNNNLNSGMPVKPNRNPLDLTLMRSKTDMTTHNLKFKNLA